MTNPNTQLLGWQPGTDVSNELAALIPTLQPHTVLEVAGNYRVQNAQLQMLDDVHINYLEPGFGWTRFNHPNQPLFKPGNRHWSIRPTCIAEGWEADDINKYGTYASTVGKIGTRFLEYDIRGRHHGLIWQDSPHTLCYRGRTEGCKDHHWLQGACHNPTFIECEGVGGYLNSLQGEFIKTLVSNQYHGPTDGLILGCFGTPKRGFFDATGGALRWRLENNLIEATDDEGLDLKKIYTNAADLAGQIAAETALVKHVTSRNNHYRIRTSGINMTSSYNSTNFAAGAVSEAQHEAACVSDIRSIGDTFEAVGTGNVEAIKNQGSRRFTGTGATLLGRMQPIAEDNSPDNQQFAPQDTKLDCRFDGEWRSVIAIKGDGFEFGFDPGSVLKDITSGRVLLAITRDLANVKFRGDATIDPSCTGPITKVNMNGHTVDPFDDTMELIAA